MDAPTRLEAALQQAAENPASRPAFYRLLLDSEVFVCGVRGDAPSEDGQQTLSLRMWPGDDGAPSLPFFTRLDLLQNTIHEQNDAVSLNARLLFEMTSGATLFLNPAEDFGKEFTPQEIATLLEGGLHPVPTEVHLAEGTRVRLGQPAQLPEQMLDALRRFLPKHANVKAAYLALMHDPATQEQPGLVIGMQVDGDFEAVFREASPIIADTAPSGISVDMLLVSAGDGDIGQYMLNDVKPFYKRSWSRSLRNLLAPA